MHVSRIFWYWTLWMSNRHTVTLHQVITVYNGMLINMDGIMWDWARKKTIWNKDLYCAVMAGWQMLSQYYAEVTPMMSLLLSSAPILHPFWRLQSFRKCDQVLAIHPQDQYSYTTIWQKPIWSIWGINSVPNIDECPSSYMTLCRMAISSPS